MANIINGTDTGSGGLITTGDSSDELQLQTAETARVTLTNTAVVVNEGGEDVDFRVEGDTNANLLFVDAGNDRAGVGTGTPLSKLEVKQTADDYFTGGFRISRFNNDTQYGTITNLGGLALTVVETAFSSPVITFNTSTDGSTVTERMRINTSGNLAFPDGYGIDFSASAGGGASSSILDDYEEGSWTPSVGGTATYIGQSGRYTKIGRLVIADFILGVDVLGTGSTTDVSGLPFSIALPLQGSGVISYFQNLAVSVISINAYGYNETNFRFYGRASSSATIAGPLSIFGNQAYIQGNIIYMTS